MLKDIYIYCVIFYFPFPVSLFLSVTAHGAGMFLLSRILLLSRWWWNAYLSVQVILLLKSKALLDFQPV